MDSIGRTHSINYLASKIGQSLACLGRKIPGDNYVNYRLLFADLHQHNPTRTPSLYRLNLALLGIIARRKLIAPFHAYRRGSAIILSFCDHKKSCQISFSILTGYYVQYNCRKKYLFVRGNKIGEMKVELFD